MAAANSIYWYDFETFGDDPRRDRASQFAGIRTDEELNIIGEPLMLYCQPASDFLPDPMSCLITGITPRHALQQGVNEAEFSQTIRQQFAIPGTCVVGYNNIRFDDEVTRQLLYRNFFDPYQREWQNGNSRWDIIDMVRLCAATRPEGIQWPKKADGSNSFRLQELTRANAIQHEAAHDALADVQATIELARLIRRQQPRLYDYVYRLRHKRSVRAMIDLNSRQPLLHVSVMYPASRGCLAVVMPVCPHPENSNGVIVYDLRVDPASWATLPEATLRERIYTPREQLPEGVERIPLKTIHYNRCPVLSSPAVLSAERAAEFAIDLEQCHEHKQRFQSMPWLINKVRQVFRTEAREPETDPDFMLYSGGFFSDHDRQLMDIIPTTSPADLGRLDLPFRDQRLPEMLFRYRARNYPTTLDADEQQRWLALCRARLQQPEALARYQAKLAEARQAASQQQQLVLDQLEHYVESIQAAT